MGGDASSGAVPAGFESPGAGVGSGPAASLTIDNPGIPKTNRPTRYPRTRATTARAAHPAKETPFERLSATTAVKDALRPYVTPSGVAM